MQTTYDNIPSELQPLSAWAYFGYTILFSIPIIGLVFLVIYAFNDSNINRRNFARSYFCSLLVAVVIFVILSAVGIFSYSVNVPQVAGDVAAILF